MIILSYGDYKTNKKIFSYEYNGAHLIPIFDDAKIADSFMQSINIAYTQSENKLIANICENPQHAYDMFVAISILSDVRYVINNPIIPDNLDNKIPIEEFIENLKLSIG